LTKAEWQPLLDKALFCLPAWFRGLIGREGHLTLIKAVLAARPIHQLLIADAPRWLLEELNKGLRAFFWAGKKRVHGGQCLVAWEVVCRPERDGGLGIKDLHLQGLALRTRWQWLRRTDPTRPWQGLPHLKDVEAEQVFESLAKIEVGDGTSVLFWKDRWINGFTASEIAPLIADLVPTRRKNKRKVSEGLLENAWVQDLAGEISIEGCIQCIRLWEEIEKVNRNDAIPDKYVWKGAKLGVYSAKDTYDMLCQGRVIDSTFRQVWKAKAPLKGKMFCWLALRYRLWTSDRRVNHSLQTTRSACFTCLQAEDTVDHILIQCPYSRLVWYGCFQAMSVHLQEPTIEDNLENWWSATRVRVPKTDRRKFDALVILIARTLWKQRNAQVFGNVHMQWTTERIISNVQEEFKLWELAFAGGSSTLMRD
jgi:hypothetical protein